MTAEAARILVVEDTPTQAALARALLVGAGYEVRIADTAQSAMREAAEWRPDAILLDLELPDYSGMEVMRRLRQEGNEATVLVATANGSINVAVEAMREGAVDFLVKPYAKTRLFVTLTNALEKRRLVRELTTVRASLDRDRFFGFLGNSPAMQAAYRTIESVAPSRASVFVTGESGTGKELAAEAVHKASPRAGRPFIALNCGAIPRDLLESEVFGHVKGAFTGATADRPGAAKAADGGTLFLDEICEMPLDMQVKLLRFVQTGTFNAVGSPRTERVDVRFVCATNRDPMAEVQAGRFREDLFYRLYVVPVELPPLRSRGEDKLLIARQFLANFATEERRGFKGFTPEAEAALLAYPWPGNVRQLQNVIRNIVVLNDGEAVTLGMLPTTLLRPVQIQAAESQDLPPMAQPPMAKPPMAKPGAIAPLAVQEQFDPPLPRPIVPPAEPPPAQFGATIATTLVAELVRPSPTPAPLPPPADEIVPLAVMERRLILAALERTGQDVPRAAAMLEVNPSTIYRKLQVWRGEGARAPA